MAPLVSLKPGRRNRDDSVWLRSKASKHYASKQDYIRDSEHVESICRGDDWDSQACVVHQQGDDGKHERNYKDEKCGRRKIEAHASTATSSEVPTSASSEEAEYNQKHHRANGGGDDRSDDTGTQPDAQLRQQPSSDKGADDSQRDVGDETEARALDDLSGQPAGNSADQ